MSLVTLKDVLAEAERGHYAVGMFDASNLEMIHAIIDAAQAENAPVILALAPVHAPTAAATRELGSLMVQAAKDAAVPVCVHYDHGMDPERIRQVLELGFSSVMYDGSILPFEENAAETKKVVTMAAAFGASVEAELGHVGGSEGKLSGDHSQFTDPQEVERFVKETGVDALAVSIGTAHGVYTEEPQLNLPLLREIRGISPVPLVLHGGSGLSDQDFTNCVRDGISKINIYTEIAKAGVEGFVNACSRTPGELFPTYMEAAKEEMQKKIQYRIRLFGSAGQAGGR